MKRSTPNITFWDLHIPENRLEFPGKQRELLGYPVEEFGTTIDLLSDRMTKREYEKLQHSLSDVIQGKVSQSKIEVSIRHRDGHWLRILFCVKVLTCDEEGKPLLIRGFSEDVTRQDSSSRILRELKIITWNWNIATGHIDIATEDLAGLGYHFPEIQNSFDQWMQLIHPDDRATISSNIDQHLKGITACIRVSGRITLQKGIWTYFLLSGLITEWDLNGEPLFIRGTIQDISTIREQELQLQMKQFQFNLALEGAQLGAWSWNRTSGSQEYTTRLRYLLGDALEKGIQAFFSPDNSSIHRADKASAVQKFNDFLEAKSPALELELRLRHKDGSWRWLTFHSRATTRNKQGNPLQLTGIVQEITEQKKARLELEESRHFLRTIIDALPTRIFWKDNNSIYQGGNRQFAQDSGLQSEREIIGKTDYDIPIISRQAPYLQQQDTTVLNSGIPQLQQEKSLTIHGEKHWFSMNRIPLADKQGEQIGLLCTYEDITWRKRQEKQLYRSNRQLELAINAAELGTWDANLITQTARVNANWRKMIGYPDWPEIINYKDFATLLHPGDKAHTIKQFYRHLAGKEEYFRVEFRLRHRRGHHIWIFSQAQLIEKTTKGKPLRMVGIHQNISRRKEHEENLARLASQDILTGCGNRLFFDRNFELEHLRIKEDPNRTASLAILDIDHFKSFNDRFGHQQGDIVLKTMAGYLQEAIGDKGILARIGGEEFGLILPDFDTLTAQSFLDTIRKGIASIDLAAIEPVLANERIHVTIGISGIRAEESQRNIFQAADAALYQGKSAGRNQTVVAKREWSSSETGTRMP